MDVNASQLQHGLVRWVQNYGEHILKTLIARSPKLPHPRRYSNSMPPGGGATALPVNGHSSSNGTSGGSGGLGAGGGGGGGRPPRPSGFGRPNKFSSREGMLVPPAYLPTAPFRPQTYPLLGSPTSVYYGMVPSLPAAAVGQMSPTGANAAGGSGSTGAAGYPTGAAVGAMPNVNQAGVLIPAPSPAVPSTMGTPLSLDSSAVSGPTQQQPSQNILFMQPLGLPHQHPQQPHLQAQVTLSGSPIQQQEFTRPSSPMSFKPPPPIAALSGAGDHERGGGGGGGGTGGVTGSEGSVSLMGSIQQQQAHLIQTQGLVTMTPIMAASASPSSSLNLSHAGMHHVHPHPLSSQQQQQLLQAQLHLHQQQAAGSSFGGGGVTSGSSLFEHVPQMQQAMRPGLPATALPPVSSVFQEQHIIAHPPPVPVPQQQPPPPPPPLMAQFHHSGVITGANLGSGEGVSCTASTTGTGTTSLPLVPPPIHPLSTGGGVVLPAGQRNESEPLLPNPPIPPLQPAKHVTSVAAGVGGVAGGGASHHSSGSHSSNNNMRKEIPCKHFLAGICPFGEKCWFAHLEPITQQQREGAGVSRGASSQQLGSSGPLQVQIPPNVWINNPNLFFDLSHFAVASPPQSPVNSALISGSRPPILPTLIRPRAYYPNFPGQQPLLLVRPPGGTAAVFPAGVQGIGMGVPSAIGGSAGGGYPFYPHTGQYQTLLNPILKFNLLSEVVIRQQLDSATEMVMENITKMITRADHFYVAYGQTINDYKILFGGNRSFQESSVLVERKVIAETVSCLHFSKQQPTLMVIGTMFGSIYTWDIRKGAAGGGMVTSAHKAELTGQPSTSITVLIHFATSINSAQVIVAGNKAGHVTWFISQPPQKTYSILYSDQTSHSPHPIVALQILGGFLITGDRGGRVILWSMQSQQPVVDSRMIAHSISLCNIHVIDTTHFITIGISPCPDDRLANSSVVSNRSEDPSNLGESKTGVPSSLDSVGVSMESMTSDFSRMSVSATGTGGLVSSEEHAFGAPPAAGVGVGGTASEAVKTVSQHPDFVISVWEFNRPPKLVHSLPINGIVISSSFHYHLPTGNMFLATGMQNGTVKIYNVPMPTLFTLSTASELHFSEMKGKDCIHVAVNLSREVPLSANAYIRNPFRDLILTTVWSDGKIMVCQVARQ